MAPRECMVFHEVNWTEMPVKFTRWVKQRREVIVGDDGNQSSEIWIFMLVMNRIARRKENE